MVVYQEFEKELCRAGGYNISRIARRANGKCSAKSGPANGEKLDEMNQSGLVVYLVRS